jgi:broad-specificity NMP kinase
MTPTHTSDNADLQPMITIVSGLPRSGTSMMMKMLEAGGLPPLTDNLRIADEDNPKGYYEFERVKQLPQGDTAWLPDARSKVVKVIAALLPHLPGDYRYHVIFMQRAMPEILASQRQMLIRRGEDPDKIGDDVLAKLFDKHLRQVHDWISRQPNVERLDVNYNEMLKNPQPFIERINVFLGGQLNTEKMAQVVDPSLHRQRKEP